MTLQYVVDEKMGVRYHLSQGAPTYPIESNLGMGWDRYPIPTKSYLQYIVDRIIRGWDDLDKDIPLQRV